MELQGSNIFSGDSNRGHFPPAIDNHSSPNQQQMNGNINSDYGNLSIGHGNAYNPIANGYQTQDIFAATSNPIIESLRALALNPSQINNLLTNLPSSGDHALPPAQKYIFYFII